MDIKSESLMLSKLATDLDNMREHYRTTNNLYIFPSPLIYTLEKNLFFLQRYSKKKVIDLKYYMRPDYLSYDEYGTVTLWPVLLYVNFINSIEDFVVPEILIPDYNAIIDCLRDNIPQKDINELLQIDL